MGFFSNLLTKKEAIFIQGNDTYTLEIIDESNYQQHLKKICGGYSKEGSAHEETAQLHYFKKKSKDAHTIRIIIKNKTVGFLSLDDAKRYKKRLKRLGEEGIIAECNAKIFGGKKLGFFDKTTFEVWLDLSIEDFTVERETPIVEELLPAKETKGDDIPEVNTNEEESSKEDSSDKPKTMVLPIDL